jgi:hypothetical protein
MPFTCSICGEESMRICVRCTKDACDNHLCEKCRKCSDCCECEVALTPHAPESVREVLHPAVAQPEPVSEPPVVPEAPEQVEPAAEAPPEPPLEPAPVPEAPAEVVAEAPAEPAQDSGSNMLP